jgi:hypothetical protein
MEPSMHFLLSPTSRNTTATQRIFASNSGTSFWRGAVVVIAIVGLALFMDINPTALAEETDEAKELPRRVLRHTPPIFEEWTFEQHGPATFPPGFASQTLGAGRPGEWTIIAQNDAPSKTHVLHQDVPCSSESCYQLLISQDVRAKYMDLSVGIFSKMGTPNSGAGLIFNAQDNQNFLTVLVYPATNTVKAFEFINGVPTLLKEQAVVPIERTPWHFMRIHLTSIVSHEVVEVSFDNKFIMSLEPSGLKSGNLGLITTGDGAFAFDNLRAVEITTGIPISRPPAY